MGIDLIAHLLCIQSFKFGPFVGMEKLFAEKLHYYSAKICSV